MQLLVVQVVKYVIIRRRLASLDGPWSLLLLMSDGVVRSVSVPRLVTRNMWKVHPISVAIAITKWTISELLIWIRQIGWVLLVLMRLAGWLLCPMRWRVIAKLLLVWGAASMRGQGSTISEVKLCFEMMTRNCRRWMMMLPTRCMLSTQEMVLVVPILVEESKILGCLSLSMEWVTAIRNGIGWSILIMRMTTLILAYCQLISRSKRVSLITMLFHMSIHCTLAHELWIAIPTNIRPVTLVSLLMIMKVIECRKATFTIGEVTLKWLLSIMYSQVSKQVSLFSKSFFAAIFRTNKWSLSSLIQ